MAWNQPGGQNNNPWGRRPGAGGPGLDEKFREWQRRVEGFFRSSGSGQGSGQGTGQGSGQGSGRLFIAVAAIAVFLWLCSGIYQIRAAERGVIQRFGRLVLVRGEGLGWHWPRPIETLTKINVAKINSSEYKSRVLTADINLVDMRFAVQYQDVDPVKVLFRVRDPDSTLREVSESAIREVVGRSNLDQVLVGASRPELTQRTKDLIQRVLDFYNTGIIVTSVNLTDVQVPEAVIPSQRDANKALADQERFVREAEAYANGIVPVAQGAAARTLQDAQAYAAQVVAIAKGQAQRFDSVAEAYSRAPDVTRQRMYLETMESVLSRAHKVFVDSKAAGNGKEGGGGGGANVFYLPLDKMLERSNTPETNSQPERSIRATPAPDIETVTVEGRSRGDR